MQRLSNFLMAATCIAVAATVASTPATAGWNPFRKTSTHQETPRDPFSTAAGGGSEHRQLVAGRPLIHSAVAAPGAWLSRVGSGTKNMLSGAGRALTFQKFRQSNEPQTVSHYQPWGQSTSTRDSASKKGKSGGWFRSGEAGPPETVQDWIAQDRPEF